MAYSEVQGKERREGLWAKCLSDTDGDQKRAEALYLRYRVRQIVQELQLRELEEAKIKSIRDERLLFNCPKCRNEISISRGELSDYGTTKHPAFRFTCPFCFRGFDVRCVVPQPAKSKAAGFPVATPCPTTSPRLVKKGLAVSSLVCGILGAWFSTLSIPAVICGHMSLSRIKKKPELYGGKRMAIAGLILGYIGLALAIAVGAVNGLTTVMLREMGLLQK